MLLAALPTSLGRLDYDHTAFLRPPYTSPSGPLFANNPHRPATQRLSLNLNRTNVKGVPLLPERMPSMEEWS